MFEINDNFLKYDYNLQPYSFELEQHTYLENLHSTVHDGAFHLQSIGNRYILNTPAFVNGKLGFDFEITFLKEYDPRFTICLGYDKKTRCGYGIRLTYKLTGSLVAELIEEENYYAKVLDTKFFENFLLAEGSKVHTEITISPNKVICSLNELQFAFDGNFPKGKIAIERQNFIGELVLSDLTFESDDTFEKRTVLAPVDVEIPLTNGGDIPYRVTWQIEEIENEYFLKYKLDGGTGTREFNKADRPMQFNVELDHMKNPYVGIFSNGKEQIFNIANGEICFVDANVYWECQKDYFENTPLPVEGIFRLDDSLFSNGKISEDGNLVFGYEHLICKGYANQQGSGEFRYNTSGTPVYQGEALDGRDIFEILSPFDKYAMSLIPANCYKREDAEAHIKYNHYFECDENIDFTLKMRTITKAEYFRITAEIQNAFETKVIDSTDVTFEVKKAEKNYNMIIGKALFGKLDIGVYKIVFNIFIGDKLYEKTKCVFEVFDKNSDENPALKSGLPFIFSMANEIKWLERNAFDLWNPKPSCDGVHYISCVTDTPIEAERRKTWELIKPFKRKWFAWLAPRTCRNYADFEAHRETLENADFLFCAVPPKGKTARCQYTQFPLRSDHWSYLTTKSKFQLEILKEFLDQNPDYATIVGIDFENEEFTFEHYERLMKNLRQEWMCYINTRILSMIEVQNKELKQINPKVKRSMYGPLSVYITPTISYRSLPDYGLPADDRLAKVFFDGFNVFEDYPIACAYPTYRGPFTLTSILLHCPGAVMYPEQYREDKGGNMDGAVKYAHSPMALYAMEPYQYSTHSFEYVFNTAYRQIDGYHYWNTYGFHRRDHGTEMLDELIKDWHHVIENKPKKPLKSMAFIAEYDESDTELDIAVRPDGDKLYAFCNKSELASGLIHECSRECGIPNGFQMKFEALEQLSPDETDLIIVPTLKNAKKEHIDCIRNLYNQGVSLIGLSDITGLEDIFGVVPQKQEHKVNCISYNGETEYIYPSDAMFNYSADSAETVVFLNENIPAVFKTPRTALINTSVLNMGCENKGQRDNRPNAYCTIGKTIRKALSDIIVSLSKPLAKGENVGVTLFETEAGHKELMAINYVPHDNRETYTKEAKVNFNFPSKEAVITFDMPHLTDVTSDRELFICKENGIVKEIRFKAKPHETVFVKLKTDM